MKITNILFCLFLLMLNGCNSNDNDTLKNNIKQTKNKVKRDLSEQEKPKSKEELLKEKLTDDQKTQLDWLKTALTDVGEFDTFLQHDEDKIKSALDHIKKELENCTGDKAEQKNTFKAIVKGALNGGKDIDNFASNASSTCNN
ncbi:Mlp family lipoprotein (plasmid) [Borreliella yangtzensis]|uniref:Tfp pilus assembly protein PilP n=1 Tax=Borreliella yangtzensis TaxID=683292 RepID=A0ABR6PB86_9SPIR|nr:Tfp pilus assembly protein PilP [Borreliella yangtzensis]